MSRNLGYLLAFASAVTGAMRYNLAVWANRETGFDYVTFLAYALVVGVLCCTIHILVRDGTKGFIPLRGRWKHALAYGVLMGWGTLAHFLALDYLNETVMTSMAQGSILLTIGLAVWLLGERFTRMEWIATIIIFGGLFAFRPFEGGGRLTGFLILMSGLVSGAFATIGAKRWVQGIPPHTLMLWRNLVALAVVGTWASFHWETPNLTWGTAAACVATGVLGPYLHGLFFLMALTHIDASKAALMNRVQPAIVFLLSWMLLGRLPDRLDIYAGALLVAGTIWLAASRPKPAKP